MSNITDAQTLAIFNAQGEALTQAMAQAAGVGQTVSPTSGTAFQVSTLHRSHLYINITTAAALTIKMGPVLGTEIVLNASESDALGLITLAVPAGWFVQLTGTMANLAITAILD